jgi:hypothetical protein
VSGREPKSPEAVPPAIVHFHELQRLRSNRWFIVQDQSPYIASAVAADGFPAYGARREVLVRCKEREVEPHLTGWRSGDIVWETQRPSHHMRTRDHVLLAH